MPTGLRSPPWPNTPSGTWLALWDSSARCCCSSLSSQSLRASLAEYHSTWRKLRRNSPANLALFYLGNAIRGFAVLSLVVALFFPYGIAAGIGVTSAAPAAIIDGAFFLLKIFLVMFVAVAVVRSAMARFKISHASIFYVMIMTIVSLVGLLLIWADMML